MPKKKTKKGPGGARPGAGRKPKTAGDPTVQVSLTLRGTTVASLDALDGNRSDNADTLIREAMGARNKKAARKVKAKKKPATGRS